MEALLAHEYFPHVGGTALVVGLFLILKCVRKVCAALCFLTGWIAAGTMVFMARHRLLRDMVGQAETFTAGQAG